MTCRDAEVSNRVERRCDPAVAIAERAVTRSPELRLQVGLRAVDDDEIRPQRQDALGVGIDQRADLRQRLHLGRELVVAADATTCDPAPTANSISVSAGTSDTMRRGAEAGTLSWARAAEREDDEGERNERDQLLRTSSHRKNGPPIMAVTTPTGISTGESIVRATRSHATRNAAPKSADAGSTIR